MSIPIVSQNVYPYLHGSRISIILGKIIYRCFSAEHLFLTLSSFYDEHPGLLDSPLYVFGQGHGAQLALALILRLQQVTISISPDY